MRQKRTPVEILCFIFLFSAFPAMLAGQANADTLPIYKGIDKFILGSAKSVYAADIGYVEGGIYTWNDTTTYTYQYCPVELGPFVFLKIPFLFLSMTFDENSILITVQFFASYADDPQTAWSRKNNAGPVNKATRDYKRSVHYFNKKWRKKGRFIVYERFSTSETNGGRMALL